MIAITDAGQIVSMRKNSFFSVSEIADPNEIAQRLQIERVSAPGLLSDIPKFPYEQWLQVVGFHRWSYKTFKQETHLSHFITKDKQFITLPFHQTVSGMTIKIDLQTPENQELLRSLEEQHGIDIGGFHGTTHNHVNTSAFQSGTDKHDEENQQGIHFTLGNLGQKDMSIHARVSAIFNGDMSLIEPGKPFPSEAKILKKMMDLAPISILSFIEVPHLDAHFKEMPKEYIDAAMKRYITGIGFDVELPFPDEWKARVTEKKYQPTQYWVGRNLGMGGTGGLPPSVGTVTQSGHYPSTGGNQTNAGQQNNVINALRNQFHMGLMAAFIIVATARNKIPKLQNFSSRDLIESLSDLEIIEKNNKLLQDFNLKYGKESMNNPSIRTLIRAIENDNVAWNNAWKQLGLKTENANSSHAFALAGHFARLFNVLFIEEMTK
jgi:hypothetical protein